MRCTCEQLLEKVPRAGISLGEVAAMNREQIEATKKQVAIEDRGTVIDRWTLQASEEGRREERAETLRKILEMRLGKKPTAVEARLAGASSEELARWLDRALKAGSLDAVFDPIQ